ncbi:MAG: DNA-processing protein DprA [Campylobacterota bacterium]|nr:DNA-processing protein DprA [Campylobacterota bacterium]
MKKIEEKIAGLASMKSYPSQLFYDGNLELLNSKKVSIVGTRKPSQYSRLLTHQLASSLSKVGVCIVSGGAMGIDALSHKGAGSANTIAVLPCGVDIKYPAVNKNLLSDIQTNGLLLSQFDLGFRATPWSFVLRNELVVALGDVLVVAEAELGSGSMRSVEFALKMGKEIFVLPQRLGESSATNRLLQENKAKAIYDIEEFVSRFGSFEASHAKDDKFLEYCKTNPTYDEVLAKFPDRVFEAELSGEIKIENAKVIVL